MRSIKFPKMFGTNNTLVWTEAEYLKATTQNVKLLLASVRGELLGDPYFGLLLKKYTFDQNNYILRDMLIDMIYTQLAIFIPQVRVSRPDINIISDKKRGQLICEFTGISQIDYTPNTYSLVLMNTSE